jgi:hypothetical protein
MDSSSIQLPDTEIAGVTLSEGQLRVHFARAYLVKTMTGSNEKTLWWQAGDLVLDEAEVQGELPDGAAVCAGGDVEENVYVYRDMIPVPLDSRGRCRCDLALKDSDQRITADGTAVRLEMRDVPKYIRHIRD